MKKITFIILILTTCVLCGGGIHYYLTYPAFEMHLMHTNDLHAHLLPFHPNKSVCTYEDKECKGGFARLKKVIDTYRQNHPDMVLLDGGDRFSGTPFYTLRKSQDITSLMNQMKYDAITLGNHDFDDGLPELEKMMESFNAPVISANVVFPESSPLSKQILPSIILEKGGKKIGIVGALTPDVKIESSNARDIDLKPLVKAIQTQINSLKEKGVKIVIVLSHTGDETENYLADSLKNVNIIIGAHSHTVKFGTRNQVLIASAGQGGAQVGAMRIVFNRLGQMVEFQNETQPLDATVNPDENMKKQIDAVAEEINTELRKPVTFVDSPVSMTPNLDYCSQNCHMGEVLTDILLSAYPQADFAFINSGAIRSGFTQGDISMRDIIQAYPFDSSLTLVEMTGAEVIAFLNHGLKKYKSNIRVNTLIHAAGLSYQFTSQDKQAVITAHNVLPWKNEKIYRVLLPSFLAEGGDGFPVFKSITEIAPSIRKTFINILKQPSFQIKPLEQRVTEKKL